MVWRDLYYRVVGVVLPEEVVPHQTARLDFLGIDPRGRERSLVCSYEFVVPDADDDGILPILMPSYVVDSVAEHKYNARFREVLDRPIIDVRTQGVYARASDLALGEIQIVPFIYEVTGISCGLDTLAVPFAA